MLFLVFRHGAIVQAKQRRSRRVDDCGSRDQATRRSASFGSVTKTSETPLGSAVRESLDELGVADAIFEGEVITTAVLRPTPAHSSPTYVAFEILWLNGCRLRFLPLRERRQRLQTMLQQGSSLARLCQRNFLRLKGDSMIRAAVFLARAPRMCWFWWPL
jgi:hypothetical protein